MSPPDPSWPKLKNPSARGEQAARDADGMPADGRAAATGPERGQARSMAAGSPAAHTLEPTVESASAWRAQLWDALSLAEQTAFERRLRRVQQRRQDAGDTRHAPRDRPFIAACGKGLLAGTAHLPLRLLHGIGRFVGLLLAWLPTRSRYCSRVNIDLCFPGLPPAERRRLVRRSLQHACCGVFEIGALWARDDAGVQALVRHVHGEEHIESALARRQGVILAAPHLGAWELFGLWSASRRAVTALYRRPRIIQLDAPLREGRCRARVRLLEIDKSFLRELVRTLERGECVMLLPDQLPIRGSGAFAPFFGVPCFTGTLLPRLAGRTGAAVLWAYAERLPRGAGFDIHIRPGQPLPADAEQGAVVVTADLERSVRECPEQYLWRYRRFRRQPPGIESPYRR